MMMYTFNVILHVLNILYKCTLNWLVNKWPVDCSNHFDDANHMLLKCWFVNFIVIRLNIYYLFLYFKTNFDVIVFQTVVNRSKNVIIVKNLPADTTELEIKNVFSKYGLINRVVLPPSGVTGNLYLHIFW